jgi:hypothetical protein
LITMLVEMSTFIRLRHAFRGRWLGSVSLCLVVMTRAAAKLMNPIGQLTAPEVYVNAERVLPCRDSARNPKSQQNGKDDLVAQRLQ